MTNATHIANVSNFTLWSKTEIEAYDQLPKQVREAIAYLDFTISCKTILMLWKNTQNLQMCLIAMKQIEQQMRDGVI